MPRKVALSYFLGLHANYETPQSLLCGDRNIKLTSSSSGCASGIDIVGAINTPVAEGKQWMPNPSIHSDSGNVLTADGVVQQLSHSGFRDLLNRAGVPPDASSHHVLIP